MHKVCYKILLQPEPNIYQAYQLSLSFVYLFLKLVRNFKCIFAYARTHTHIRKRTLIANARHAYAKNNAEILARTHTHAAAKTWQICRQCKCRVFCAAFGFMGIVYYIYNRADSIGYTHHTRIHTHLMQLILAHLFLGN